MVNLLKIALITVSFIISGCVSHEPPNGNLVTKSSITPATITQIKKGTTTKNDIINLLGSPNISDSRTVRKRSNSLISQNNFRKLFEIFCKKIKFSLTFQ